MTLTTLPAGHVFGSAMLHVAGPQGTLLYTGDFKLRPSATAEPRRPPRVDVLVMESTYGEPRYRLPPRDEAIAQLVGIVQRTLEAGRTPVVHAYVLGKAQEVTRILSRCRPPRRAASARPRDQPDLSSAAAAIWGRSNAASGPPPDDAVVVAPPRNQKAAALIGLRRPVSIAVTGWAIDPAWRLAAGGRLRHAAVRSCRL